MKPLLLCLVFLSLIILCSSQIEQPDYLIDYLNYQPSVDWQKTAPASGGSTWAYFAKQSVPFTSTSTKLLLPTDPTKATFAIIPNVPLTSASWGTSVPANPTVATQGSTVTVTSLPTTDPLVEGHIYHVSGQLTATTSFTFTWPTYKPAAALDYYILLFGCIIPSTSSVTTCAGSNVGLISSTWVQIPASTATTVPNNSYAAVRPTKSEMTCSLNQLGTSSIQERIGSWTVPTGAQFSCQYQFIAPLDTSNPLAVSNTYAMAVQVTHDKSTVPSAYTYGHPIPEIINSQEVSRLELLSGGTDAMEWLKVVQEDGSFAFSPFQSNFNYNIRFRIQDSTTTGIQPTNLHYTSIPFYYTSQLSTDFSPPLKVISDCELYQRCLTSTPTPSHCNAPDYLTSYRSINDFSCQCNPTFGGAFCDFTWLQGTCATDIALYFCYQRQSMSHLQDSWWTRLSEVANCEGIAPPVHSQCTLEDQTVACLQVNPDPHITAATSPADYALFTLGSRIECSPYNLSSFDDYLTMELSVYVIWNRTQTQPNSAADQLAFKRTYFIKAGSSELNLSFDLTDPSWFVPPTSLVATDPSIKSTDARFYVGIVPTSHTTSPVYSPIYRIKSACDYYNSICPAADNYIQCEDFRSAPYVSLIDLNTSNCECRSGFVSTGNACTVFSISSDCPDGKVTLDGCCETYPLLQDVKTQCRDNFLDAPPQFTAIELTHVNDLSVSRISDTILNYGDSIRIQWGTTGNIYDVSNNSLMVDIYLFAPPTIATEYKSLPPRRDGSGNLIESNIDDIIALNFNNLGDQFVFSVPTDSSEQPLFFPLHLTRVELSLSDITLSVPNLPLNYNAILVMVFQTPPTASSAQRWVVGHSKTQFFHTNPQCSQLTKLSSQVLQWSSICANADCDITSGQCNCSDLYNKYITFPSSPNLCEVNVCAGYLACYNGRCDSTTFTCNCSPGWTGEHCDISIECNPTLDPALEPPADDPDAMSTCGDKGYFDQNAQTMSCDADCTCLSGYSNPPSCNTCSLQCSHLGSPVEDCSSCRCNRYTDGPTCTCFRLPVLISVLYNTIELDSSSLEADGTVLLQDQDVSLNSEARGYISGLITQYYVTVGELLAAASDTEPVTAEEIAAATDIVPIIISSSQLLFNITTPHALNFFAALLRDEIAYDESDFTLDYITVIVVIPQTDPYDPITTSPSQFQPLTFTLSGFIYDDCNAAQTSRKLAQNTLQALQFIQNIRQGNAKFQHIWGQYREVIQYLYEAELENQIEANNAFPIHYDRGYVFTPFLPPSMASLRSFQRTATDTPLLISPTITMVQFDRAFYSCSTSNAIAESSGSASLNQDVIKNGDGDNIALLPPEALQFQIDLECLVALNSASIFQPSSTLSVLILSLIVLLV